MQITIESLQENIKSLRIQQEQGLSLHQQASGAIQLAEALMAQLNDALTEGQLGDMLDAAQKDTE